MSNHNSSGLLRFRSAPNSVLSMDKVRNSNDGSTSRISASSGGGGGGGGGGASFEGLPPPLYVRRSLNSADMDQPAMGSSTLLRQNSSPAGLLSRITPSNGEYGPGNYRVSSGDPLSSSRGRYSNYAYPSLGLLSRISENETEGAVGLDAAATIANGNGSSGGLYSSSVYPFSSCEHGPSEAFAGLKREVDNNGHLFAAGAQNGEIFNRSPISLSHHLSLPKTSAAIDKLMLSQDSVPCKIRAKRGCATHPRSIAERVRRTRISERMRKLQELVPNMDKQTNTADMLDLAVDYIKDLQKQYKTLSDTRANCRCLAGQKPVRNY